MSDNYFLLDIGSLFCTKLHAVGHSRTKTVIRAPIYLHGFYELILT